MTADPLPRPFALSAVAARALAACLILLEWPGVTTLSALCDCCWWCAGHTLIGVSLRGPSGAEQGRYPPKVPLILPVAGAAAGLVSPNATRRNVEP